MKADLNLDQVLRLARVLTPATAPAWHGAHHFLHLHVAGNQLTITAGNVELTAKVHLPGGLSDGTVAVVPEELIAALNAVAPTGRGRHKARVSVHADLDRLHLDGPAASVPSTPTTASPSAATCPTTGSQPSRRCRRAPGWRHWAPRYRLPAPT